MFFTNLVRRWRCYDNHEVEKIIKPTRNHTRFSLFRPSMSLNVNPKAKSSRWYTIKEHISFKEPAGYVRNSCSLQRYQTKWLSNGTPKEPQRAQNHSGIRGKKNPLEPKGTKPKSRCHEGSSCTWPVLAPVLVKRCPLEFEAQSQQKMMSDDYWKKWFHLLSYVTTTY